MMTLMAVSQILLLALLGSPQVVTEDGQAAVYGHAGDRLAGGPLACSGKRLSSRDLVCAHRTLPCGTNMLVFSLRTQRLAACQVLDRGPFGARLASGKFVIKKRPSQRGTWRAVVDMAPAVAGMLGVRDTEPVRLIYLRKDERPGSHFSLDGGKARSALLAALP
jgi:hypothetical protein